jgi:small subunit ribosomal protein S3Ae
MAAKIKKAKGIDKWRKKRYFSILAPKVFQERELGQTLAYEPGELNGRCISANLMMLTGNIKRQNINMTFRVNKVQGDTAFAIVERYEVVPSAIKRKVRRQKDRIDASFDCITKDNKRIKIKPMIVTNSMVSRSIKSALRKEMIRTIALGTRTIDYDTVVVDIINEQFQRNIWASINKISPVRSVDIRIMKYLGDFTGNADAFIQGVIGKAKIEEKKREAEEVLPEEEAPAAEEQETTEA